MYRTDRQFMKNPATASSRIYVGNLAETVVLGSMEEKFSPHGKILGLVVQRGFGFVQFETDQQAQAAIANEHLTMFHGRKLIVRQAIDNAKIKQQQQQQQQGGFNQKGFQNNFNKPPQQQQQQQHQNQPPKVEESKPPIPPPKEQAPPPPQQQPPKAPAAPPQQRPEPMDDGPHDKRNKRGGNVGKQQRPPMKRNFRDNYREDGPPPFFEPPPPIAYDNPYVPGQILERPDRNDCEIIVVAKLLTEYAEYIEQRLKSLGLIVDLLFPNEDVPIGRVLANISSRGCLYAILVMPQNEEHRSLTLNILHGVPEEHRNMPIEDALLLITRNFEVYMKGEKTSSTDTDKTTLMSRHPEHLQVIINLLAENRQINTNQYDRMIGYLKEKRELQSQFEISEGIETGIEAEAKTKHSELQNRIMNILNKKGSGDEPPPPVVKVPDPPKTTTSAPLLNDPSVQKALDSLLLGDMFKGLAS